MFRYALKAVGPHRAVDVDYEILATLQVGELSWRCNDHALSESGRSKGGKSEDRLQHHVEKRKNQEAKKKGKDYIVEAKEISTSTVLLVPPPLLICSLLWPGRRRQGIACTQRTQGCVDRSIAPMIERSFTLLDAIAPTKMRLKRASPTPANARYLSKFS